MLLKVLVIAAIAALFWLVNDAHEAQGRPFYSTYATCYDLRGTMANGRYVHRRAAASNVLRLGTKIRLVGPHTGPHGIRRYIVSDTGSALGDGHLDLWSPTCSGWPNPRVTYHLGWRK